MGYFLVISPLSWLLSAREISRICMGVQAHLYIYWIKTVRARLLEFWGRLFYHISISTYLMNVKARKTQGRWGEDVGSVLIAIILVYVAILAIRRERSPLASFLAICS